MCRTSYNNTALHEWGCFCIHCNQNIVNVSFCDLGTPKLKCISHFRNLKQETLTLRMCWYQALDQINNINPSHLNSAQCPLPTSYRRHHNAIWEITVWLYLLLSVKSKFMLRLVPQWLWSSYCSWLALWKWGMKWPKRCRTVNPSCRTAGPLVLLHGLLGDGRVYRV